MNTNPYEPPHSVDEPPEAWRFFSDPSDLQSRQAIIAQIQAMQTQIEEIVALLERDIQEKETARDSTADGSD
jgi:hypothetical protein